MSRVLIAGALGAMAVAATALGGCAGGSAPPPDQPSFYQSMAQPDVTVDAGLTAAELDSYDGGVSRAAVAIAETGTIVLDGSPGQGRRAITLVPDYHLCIVTASQVVHLVPEAVNLLAAAARVGPDSVDVVARRREA